MRNLPKQIAWTLDILAGLVFLTCGTVSNDFLFYLYLPPYEMMAKLFFFFGFIDLCHLWRSPWWPFFTFS